MVEIIKVTLIEASNLSYTITIGTFSAKETERIYTFKLLVSKLLGGSEHLPGVQTFGVQTRGGVGVSEIWTMSKIWKFFF